MLYKISTYFPNLHIYTNKSSYFYKRMLESIICPLVVGHLMYVYVHCTVLVHSWYNVLLNICISGTEKAR